MVKGALDEAVLPKVRGWITESGTKEPLYVAINKGEEVRIVCADQLREDVRDAGLSEHADCGFQAFFSPDNYHPASARILLPGDFILPTRKSYANRKLFFIHIPKTAGSSVNEFIKSSLAEGEFIAHIEGIRKSWKDDARKVTALSGHIRYPEFNDFFGKQNRVLVCFFRDPYRQLVSHLYWVRHLSEPGNEEFLAGHPEIIRKMSQNLVSVDLSDAEQLKDYFHSLNPVELGLFDNYHVRFLSSPKGKVTETDLSESLKILNRIHIIGLAEDMLGSMNSISLFMGFPKPAQEARKNVNPYQYGIDLSSDRVREILFPYVQYDLALYEAAKVRYEFQKQLIPLS